jgi:hypothetical protein
MLEWVKVVGPIVVSWPLAAVFIVLLFRSAIGKLFTRFMDSSGSKAEIGPLKIELGKLAEQGKDVVSRLNRTIELMADSRLLELEITSKMFGQAFAPEQQSRMRKHIEELRSLTAASS